MKATWRMMLEAAREEALLAVDLYNQPRQPRRLEGFLVHMHIAWLYLLHAEFQRDGVDYHYRLPNGWYERVDGEPKTWELSKCVSERWSTVGAVRKNLELTIGLRNKIEHRFHESTVLATSGYAQSLLLNFEEELTSAFDPKYSLGEHLRFPIFVGAIALGSARLEELRDQLPASTKNFLATFESGLDPVIASDHRYEFRVHLLPKLGTKTEADRAMTFVREGDLTPEQKQALQGLGKAGSVIVREQIRSIPNAGLLKPTVVVEEIQQRIPFRFNMHHFVLSWRKLKCRPGSGSKNPERTDERYCVYNELYQDYLYKPAFVEKVVRETDTAEKFKKFLGSDPLTR